MHNGKEIKCATFDDPFFAKLMFGVLNLRSALFAVPNMQFSP